MLCYNCYYLMVGNIGGRPVNTENFNE